MIRDIEHDVLSQPRGAGISWSDKQLRETRTFDKRYSERVLSPA
jgi:hypothetical protein